MKEIKPDPQSYAIHWILDPQRETYIWIVEFVCDTAVGANSGFQGSQLTHSLPRRTPLQNTPAFKIVPGGEYYCVQVRCVQPWCRDENKTRMARINLDINLHSFDIKKRKLRIAGYFQTLQGSFWERLLVVQVSPSPIYVLLV